MDNATELDKMRLYVAICYAALESILAESEAAEPGTPGVVLTGQLETIQRTAFGALARIPAMPTNA